MSWRQARAGGQHPQQRGNRLKEVRLDPLEAIGLPSRGESSLLNLKTQEDYYTKILDRYRQLQRANSQDEYQLKNTPSPSSQHNGEGESQNGKEGLPPHPFEPSLTSVKDEQRRELEILIAAMRKLKESIVASRRVDSFALSVYIFIIRATILLGRIEYSHPALLHLLRYILPANPSTTVTSETKKQFIGYFVLDLACRQNNLREAYYIRHVYKYQNETVDSVLRAIAREEWYSYWRYRERLDKYQKQLCGGADERMRERALDCLEKSYRGKVPKSYIEAVAGRKFSNEELGEIRPSLEMDGDDFVVSRRSRNR